MMFRPFPAALAAAALFVSSACTDNAPAPAPASIEVVWEQVTSAPAGSMVSATPAFRVEDANGNILGGVEVTVAVSAGGGALIGAPTRTIRNEPTSVGIWTLGKVAGRNELTISVAGLAPATVTAAGVAGAAAKLVPQSPQTINGVVGGAAAVLPAALVADAFDNPIAGGTVTVSLAGGGVAPASITADASGIARVPSWTFGTVKGTQQLTVSAGAATLPFTATVAPGPAATLTAINAGSLSAPANVALATPPMFAIRDQYGNGVPAADVTFAVTAGGGRLAATSARSGEDGLVSATWTLGTTVAPQRLRASHATLTTEVPAAVATDYDIDIRFYGPEMTAAQKALFTNAAARLRAIVTGDVPNEPASRLDASSYCGISGLPVLTEAIDDLVIFASVKPIDGERGVLARAGPCAIRSAASGSFPLFGVMEFDAADIASLDAQGRLQDVIMHEMLHVIGVGTMWPTKSLVFGAGTPGVGYSGAAGIRGCNETGGTAWCSTSVPVENTGGGGTANAHWRESVFGTELMTGYANNAVMPISLLTTGGLEDLGYGVNHMAADLFRVPNGASTSIAPSSSEPWETGLPVAPRRVRP